MPKRDLNTIDLVQQKLRLAEDVLVWPVRECGELVYRSEICSLHQFFRVGYAEYVLILMLDGKTTLPEACGLAVTLMNQSPSKTAFLIDWTIDRRLMDDCVARSTSTPSSFPNRTAKSRSRMPWYWLVALLET